MDLCVFQSHAVAECVHTAHLRIGPVDISQKHSDQEQKQKADQLHREQEYAGVTGLGHDFARLLIR